MIRIFTDTSVFFSACYSEEGASFEIFRQALRGQLKSILEDNKQATIEQIVRKLNPVIRGWANYYRHVVSRKTFDYIGHRLWQMMWQWAKRRHRNQSSKWVKQRYFKRQNGWDWVFGNQAVTLLHPSRTPITRFIKVTGYHSPYDPALRDYWEKRTRRAVGRETFSRLRLDVLRRQNYKCYQCGNLFQPEQAIDLHHDIPRRRGGSDLAENRRALHDYCHHQLHQRRGYKVFKA
jgi:RNA-directed DNA polymerase